MKFYLQRILTKYTFMFCAMLYVNFQQKTDKVMRIKLFLNDNLEFSKVEIYTQRFCLKRYVVNLSVVEDEQLIMN